MPTDIENVPQPHMQPWYTRLLQAFGWGAHPTPEGRGDGGGGDKDTADPMSIVDKALRGFYSEKDRTKYYRLCDELDTLPFVSSTLDMYAEESTQVNYETGRSISIESKHQHMIDAGMVCLNNLKSEETVTGITRSTCQRGDHWRRMIYASGRGVLGWKMTPAEQVSRYEDKYGRLVGFKESSTKEYRGERKRTHSWPWDYIHFRLLANDASDSLYGRAVIHSSYRAAIMLKLATDAMFAFRIRRGPDRAMFWLDANGLDPTQEASLVNRFRRWLNQSEYLNKDTNEYLRRYNPLTATESVVWSIGGKEDRSRVETIPGGGDPGQIYDVDRLAGDYYASVRIPKAYAGMEESVNGKASLMQLDIRFARTLKRVQKAVMYGFRTALDIHFMLIAQDAEDRTKYDPDVNEYVLKMTPVSYLDEFERAEIVRMRGEIMQTYAMLGEPMRLAPAEWSAFILTNFGRLPEALVNRLVANANRPPETEQEAIDFAKLEQKHGLDAGSLEAGGEYKGFSLNEAERAIINKMVRSNPRIQLSLANLREVTEDYTQQRDPAMCPPMWYNGEKKGFETIDYAEGASDDYKILMEDIGSLARNRERIQDDVKVFSA